MTQDELSAAVDAALAGDWHGAHRIVQQDESNALACWVHAVLHKIEGDAWNSRYWYGRSAHRYEDWADPVQELEAARREIILGPSR